VKISDVFRKRALFGVAVCCIAAIAAVGALSTGGNKEDDIPDSLVDLNETEQPGDSQVAEGAGKEPEVKEPGQVAEQPDEENQNQVAEQPGGEDSSQVALGGEKEPEVKQPEIKEPDRVADQPEIKEPDQVAEQPEEPDQTEVLSPGLIAEQLKFDKSMGLLWPVAGEVIIPYSPDHGVFYQTLDQFSTSEAMILSSSVGTEVKAAAKGVVTSIEEDVRTGMTVTLALGNDTSLVYGQLAVADLKEGDVVEAGECIGTIAEPTRYYVVEGPNLYFKVMEGEESLNPAELLKTE